MWEVISTSLMRSQGTLEEALALVSRMGFRRVELGVLSWCDLKPANLTADYRRELDRVRRLLERFGLKAAALNAGMKDRTPEEMRVLAEFAADVSAEVLTVNPDRADADWDEEIGRLKELVRICAGKGVQAAVETHMFSMTELPENALSLAEHVPGLGLTLDVSHYYCNGSEDRIGPLLPYVKHVHVRDCGRTWDRIQLPCGDGLFDPQRWADELSRSGYEGWITVEYIDLPGTSFSVEEAALRCKQAMERAAAKVAGKGAE